MATVIVNVNTVRKILSFWRSLLQLSLLQLFAHGELWTATVLCHNCKNMVVDIVNDVGFIYFATLSLALLIYNGTMTPSLSASPRWGWDYLYVGGFDCKWREIWLCLLPFATFPFLCFFVFVFIFVFFYTPTCLSPSLPWPQLNLLLHQKDTDILIDYYHHSGTSGLPDFDSSQVPNAWVSQLDGSGAWLCLKEVDRTIKIR